MQSKRLVIVLKVIFAILVIAALFFASAGSYTDSTTWRHALMGKEFMKDMTFPAQDNLSYTGSSKWDKSTWFFDLFTYSAAYAAGISRLKYIKFIFFILIAGMIFLIAYKKQQGKYLSITIPIGLFGMLLINYYLKIVPNAFSMIFAAYFLYVLEQEPSKRNALLYSTLPFITLFWANVDKSVVAGPILIFIYLLYYIVDMAEMPAKRDRYNSPAILIVFAASGAVSLLSPSFVTPYTSLISHFSAGPAEWLAFISHGAAEKLQAGLLFIYLLVYIFVLVMNERGADNARKSELVRDVLTALIFIALCIGSISFVPVFLIVTIPVVMYYSYLIFRWSFVWPKQWTETNLVQIKNTLYIILIPLVAAYCIYKYMEPKKKMYPDGAIAYMLNAKPPKNLFVPIQWTGYTGYYLPGYQTLWDGNPLRAEDVKKEYEVIAKGSLDIAPIIERRSINTFMLPINWPLNDKLKSLGFKTAYFDNDTVIMVNPAASTNYFKFNNPTSSIDSYDKTNYVTALAETLDFAGKYPSLAVHKRAAMMYLEKDKKKAVAYIEDTLSDFPEETELQAILGKIYYDDGEYVSAIDSWEQLSSPELDVKQMLKAAKLKLARTEE